MSSLLGAIAGGLYLISRTWAAIEQPLLEFIFLGIIPGTDYIIQFDQAMLVLITVALVFTLFAYRRYLLIMRGHSLLQDIELIAL